MFTAKGVHTHTVLVSHRSRVKCFIYLVCREGRNQSSENKSLAVSAMYSGSSVLNMVLSDDKNLV